MKRRIGVRVGQVNLKLQKPSRNRAACFVIAIVEAIVGSCLFVGAWRLLDPVETNIVSPNAVGGSTLEVLVFDRSWYIKTSTDPRAFELEADFWGVWAQYLFMLIGTFGGGYVGWRLGLLLRRCPNMPGDEFDQLADYNDARLA